MIQRHLQTLKCYIVISFRVLNNLIELNYLLKVHLWKLSNFLSQGVLNCSNKWIYHFDIIMAYNGVLTPPAKAPPPPKSITPPVLKFFSPSPPVLNLYIPPLQLEMAASSFFTHGYFQQAHVHVSEAIITD